MFLDKNMIHLIVKPIIAYYLPIRKLLMTKRAFKY